MKKTISYLYVILGAACWGFIGLFNRMLGEAGVSVWNRVFIRNFISLVLLTVVFALFPVGNVFLRMLIQLALLPLVVGITYEFNRYVGGHDNPLTNFLASPGLWMQNFTTFEPDDSMIEVAIQALELVIPEEKGKDRW